MRVPYQLTDIDDTNAQTIPNVVDYQLDTPYHVALLQTAGADGAYDLHGNRRSPQNVGSCSIKLDVIGASVAALQTALNDLRSGVQGSTRTRGRRKLWVREAADSSAARWTYARATRNPNILWQSRNLLWVPVNLEFVLPEPIFYDALTSAWITGQGQTPITLSTTVVPEAIDPNLTFIEFTIAATPFTFTLTNAGNEHTRRAIFRFISQGVNGFTNPKIENLTTGQDFQSTTDGATASHILSVDASPGLGKAQLSVNAGSTWADDTAALTLGSLQAVMMELQPGANSMRYTDGGTPNLKIQVWYLHGYRE